MFFDGHLVLCYNEVFQLASSFCTTTRVCAPYTMTLCPHCLTVIADSSKRAAHWKHAKKFPSSVSCHYSLVEGVLTKKCGRPTTAADGMVLISALSFFHFFFSTFDLRQHIRNKLPWQVTVKCIFVRHRDHKCFSVDLDKNRESNTKELNSTASGFGYRKKVRPKKPS